MIANITLFQLKNIYLLIMYIGAVSLSKFLDFLSSVSHLLTVTQCGICNPVSISDAKNLLSKQLQNKIVIKYKDTELIQKKALPHTPSEKFEKVGIAQCSVIGSSILEHYFLDSTIAIEMRD